MGWQIALMEDTVALTKKQAQELLEAEDFIEVMIECNDLYGDDWEDMIDSDKLDTCFNINKSKKSPVYTLVFNEDHMEHMDYVPQIASSLAQVGANGRICFGSLSGDNKGQFWGIPQHALNVVKSEHFY